MEILEFKPSQPFTLGVELELQLINPEDYDLASSAKELLRQVSTSQYADYIKPEMTQSMVELNSSVHEKPHTLLTEFNDLKAFLAEQAQALNLRICGGGTHPFQRWDARAIFPTHRARGLSRLYGYLAKRFTVFGLHVHLGCASGDDAIYLSHMLARYIPHLIALSASSPFYQGVNTAFHSSRVNVVNAFPLSGFMPYVKNWQEFSEYYKKMYDLQVIKSMKDFYWDIRPKPEFGTVEVRICDTPLTVERTVMIAAYLQTLASYLLQNKASLYPAEFYQLYAYNRFQASRFGMQGYFVDPLNNKRHLLKKDILETVEKIKPHAKQFQALDLIEQVAELIKAEQNDAVWLRDVYKDVGNLAEVVQKQCDLWEQ